MTRRRLLQSISCLLLVVGLLGFDSSSATNFRLGDFIQFERSSAETLLPQITTSYPTAKFFLSGFSTVSGDWKFVRIEDPQACEADVCPTVVVHSAVDWKVMVLATRDILVSLNFEGGEQVQCELKTKGERIMAIRYSNANKTIFVAP
jgi:hypothetical protein